MPMTRLDTFNQEKEAARRLVLGVRQVLSELPKEDFKLSISQQRAIERVLLTAPVGDRPVWEQLADQLALIGPIVCKCPEEQKTYQRLAIRRVTLEQQHYGEDAVKKPATVTSSIFKIPPKTPVAGLEDHGDSRTDKIVQEQARSRTRTAMTVALALAALLIAGVVLMQMMVNQAPEISDPIKNPGAGSANWTELFQWFVKIVLPNLRWLGVLVPLLVAGLFIYFRRRMQRFLERRLTGAKTAPQEPLQITVEPAEIFGPGTQQRMLALRKPLTNNELG